MDQIESNLHHIQERINNACRHSHRSAEEITLVAVTKTVDVPSIKTAFDLGLRHFGENRIQEAVSKIELLSHEKPAIAWHMIGHLQTNKARQAVALFDIIESIDSAKLADILNKQATKRMPILIQVNIAGENTKSGFSPNEIEKAMEEISGLPNMEIKGLMTIAPLVDNPEDVRYVFKKLRVLRDRLGLEHLSMGMTDDFEVAIEEGATIIRIGRAIFGERRISC
jgi:pyridoxal phosphate enzyme (YggS family)